MPAEFELPASRFTKSRDNRRTERKGMSILLRDQRFQFVGSAVKARILDRVGRSTDFGIQTFDLVMSPVPLPVITLETVDSVFDELTLVEMKVTKKPIRNAALNGFFFGATARERAMASLLGDRYRFAFVVLSEVNDYSAPFAVLLTLDELERRTRPWRLQYQVNFRTDLTLDDVTPSQVVVLGDEKDLDAEI